MLFLLSSEIQSGKTRWLEALVQELVAEGFACSGVLAPGVWRELDDGAGFEKLGIDNVLLPSGERIAFGRRRDLVERGDSSSAGKDDEGGLEWVIFDDAVDRVNEHFRALSQRSHEDVCAPGLLIVDEMGRLELQSDKGLLVARRLLEEGPSPAFSHALVVVRSRLVDLAEARFAEAWGGSVRIAPDKDGALLLKSHL